MVHGLFLTLVNVIEIHEKNSAHFKYENTFASGCVVRQSECALLLTLHFEGTLFFL